MKIIATQIITATGEGVNAPPHLLVLDTEGRIWRSSVYGGYWQQIELPDEPVRAQSTVGEPVLSPNRII